MKMEVNSAEATAARPRRVKAYFIVTWVYCVGLFSAIDRYRLEAEAERVWGG